MRLDVDQSLIMLYKLSTVVEQEELECFLLEFRVLRRDV